MVKTCIVLHHSAVPQYGKQADSVRAHHRANPRIKQDGAYHYFIEADGEVVQFRDEESIGYHAGNWWVNVKSIGICLAGDFTHETPDDRQVDALYRIVTGIQTRWGIPDSQIMHHSEIKATSCPGTDLRGLLLDWRKKTLHNRLRIAERALPRWEGTRRGKLLTRLVNRLKRVLFGV